MEGRDLFNVRPGTLPAAISRRCINDYLNRSIVPERNRRNATPNRLLLNQNR